LGIAVIFFNLFSFFNLFALNFKEKCSLVFEEEGALNVSLYSSSLLLDFVFCLKNHMFFVCDQLLDVWGVDFPSQKISIFIAV